MGQTLKLGTRGSALALRQAEWVAARMMERTPGLEVRLSVIKTRGDKILDVPLAQVGGKGLFVREIEEALMDGRVDLAVHSVKDMPAQLPPGLCLGAIPVREDPRDVLIGKNGGKLTDLAPGARVGTSSLRRAAQLLSLLPDLSIVSLRGNLDTRMKKLESEGLDAIVVAAAGVKRLGLEKRITQYLDERTMLPAIGQGALGIELRREDFLAAPFVSALDDEQTRVVVEGERSFLRRLGGGCQVPVAGHGKLRGGRFHLTGLVAGLKGKPLLRETISGSPENAEALGRTLAERLLERGADAILARLGQATQTEA